VDAGLDAGRRAGGRRPPARGRAARGGQQRRPRDGRRAARGRPGALGRGRLPACEACLCFVAVSGAARADARRQGALAGRPPRRAAFEARSPAATRSELPSTRVSPTHGPGSTFFTLKDALFPRRLRAWTLMRLSASMNPLRQLTAWMPARSWRRAAARPALAPRWRCTPCSAAPTARALLRAAWLATRRRARRAAPPLRLGLPPQTWRRQASLLRGSRRTGTLRRRPWPPAGSSLAARCRTGAARGQALRAAARGARRWGVRRRRSRCCSRLLVSGGCAPCCDQGAS